MQKSQACFSVLTRFALELASERGWGTKSPITVARRLSGQGLKREKAWEWLEAKYTATKGHPVPEQEPPRPVKRLRGRDIAWVLTDAFYTSRPWRKVRFDVLKASNGSCCLCGRSPRQHGVVLHVDHIKPRSKHPELALTRSNLQVLCEDCNLGKGNTDDTDWAEVDNVIRIDDVNWRTW